MLEQVRLELEYEGPLRFDPLHEKNPNHQNQYVLAITDNYMCKQLKKIGVVERKSLILQFPDFLRPDLIRHFVRGYFDGDGCVYYDVKRNKCTTNIVGTLEFCTGVSNIMSAMFIKNNIYKPRNDEKNTYVLQTSANLSSYKFLSWIYRDCDIKMRRKYESYLSFCEKYQEPKRRIKSL